MIEEEEFLSILSVARRILDVYGRCEASDAPRISHTDGEMSFSSKHSVIDIFFRGSLVFRHDPNGEMTDFFEVHGIWIDEVERIAQSIPSSSSGIASQR
jgi:hypothetical protein